MLDNLNIVRDCYWLMPSGDRYLIDENNELSSQTHGLYTSFNSNDNQYIKSSNSGEINYYGRLESSNTDLTHLHVHLRAECIPEGSAVLYINNLQMTSIPVSGGVNDYEDVIELDNSEKYRIHYGRIAQNYDYFKVQLGSQEENTFVQPDIWVKPESMYRHAGGSGALSNGDPIGSWRSVGKKDVLFQNRFEPEFMPRYTASVINGQAAARFWNPSGMFLANEFTASDAPLVSSSGTVCVIAQFEEQPGTGSVILAFNNKVDSAINASWRIGVYSSTDKFWYLYNTPSIIQNSTSTDWVFASGSPAFIEFKHQFVGKTGYEYLSINSSGTSMGQGPGRWWGEVATALTNNAAMWCIGNYWDGDNKLNADFGFDGFISEIMMYEQPLSSGGLMALETYVNDKYGLSNSYTQPQMKLYDISIAYSGDRTWDNHQTGLPNVISQTLYPTSIYYTEGLAWSGDYTAINTGISAIDVDDAYIENNYTTGLVRQTFVDDILLPGGSYSRFGDYVPSGYLGVYFKNDNIDPLTSITRAVMTLRMSLPTSAVENNQDAFEINGYNSLYKNQDNREELLYINTSQIPVFYGKGYYLYGAGETVTGASFQNYQTELNFLDPYQPSGNYSSIIHANADMLANMEFQLIGIPSGTRISAAELQIEYLPNDTLPLYITGKVYRCAASGEVDAGTLTSFNAGHGGWHHQGWQFGGSHVLENDIFTNFYTFSEGPGNTRTYPESTKHRYFTPGEENYTVYGDYVLFAPRGTDGDEGDVTAFLKDPQRREYYRNPISARDLTPAYEQSARDISTLQPHYYRNMIYHGAVLDYVDVESGDGDLTALDLDDICQIYFEDRINLAEDFTLYFSLYRDYGFQSYGRFFHRGLTVADGVTKYEIYGDLEPNLVRFTVQGSNGNDYRVEVEINQYTKEPILVWFSCGYEAVRDSMTTMALRVHQDTKNYFSQDWLYATTTFPGHRKQYSSNTQTIYRPDGTPYIITWGGPRTILGTLERLTVYQQMSRRLYLHHASPVEFGYADEYIDLDANTSDPIVQFAYDTSSDKDKKFLSSRIATSQYLQTNPSGIRWVVPNGSGEATWQTRYNFFESWNRNIHSVFNPVSTAGTNNVVHPSAVFVGLDLTNSTNHPSGLNIIIDVEFDSGTSDNWKVAHTEINNIPSGGADVSAYLPIYYTTSTTKHINMDEGPIEFSDLSNLNITLTTLYPSDGENEYHGTVEIRSLQVHLDSYCVAATGDAFLNLYTTGEPTTNTDVLDLYTIGHSQSDVDADGGLLDLYIRGIPYTANSGISLLIEGNPLQSYYESMNLFIEGLDPPDASGELPMFVWGTTYPAIREFSTLYINSNLDPRHMLPLYLHGYDNTTEINDNTTLYIDGAIENVDNSIALYMAQNDVTNNLTQYTYGYDTSITEPAYYQADGTTYLIDKVANTLSPLIFGNTTDINHDTPDGLGGISLGIEVNTKNVMYAPYVYELGTSDGSMCAWVKTTSLLTYPSIQMLVLSPVSTLGFYGNIFCATYSDSLGANIRASGNFDDVKDDQWHHVASVIDRDGDLTLYIDGEKAQHTKDISYDSTHSKTGTTHMIGYMVDDGAGSGNIHDVRMYNQTLTQQEVVKIKNDEYISKQPYAHWLFNDSTPLSLYISGSGLPPSKTLKLYTHGF